MQFYIPLQMPLARSAMYAQGSNLHIAIWPGSDRLTRDITRFVAMEGRTFVVSAGGTLADEDITDFVPHAHLVRGKR